MKRILIVDDDISFLHSLIDGFKAYEDKFSIVTAGNGIEAMECLVRQEINLVLTDLKMPRMDGFELVAHLSRTYSEIPVIVMTAFGTPEMGDNLREMGTFQYIEKPIDFTLLVDKILHGLAGSSKGFITGVSLSSFLQLLELDKKSCTLTITAGNKKGIMFFRDGVLLDAAYNNLHASEAAFEIVSWKNVGISIDNRCSITEEKISASLGFILLEGSRRKDESDDIARKSSPPGEQSPMGSLDSLNMEDLELDLSAKKAPPPAGTLSTLAAPIPTQTQAQPPVSDAVARNPVLAQFITLLSSFPEIESATVCTKSGTVLHQTGDGTDNVANFITYVAVATEQIEITVGASEQQYATFTLDNGSKLIVLCGSEVIVGLRVGSSVFPAPIADGLRPILSRISLVS